MEKLKITVENFQEMMKNIDQGWEPQNSNIPLHTIACPKNEREYFGTFFELPEVGEWISAYGGQWCRVGVKEFANAKPRVAKDSKISLHHPHIFYSGFDNSRYDPHPIKEVYESWQEERKL